MKRPIQSSRIRVPGRTQVHNPGTGQAIKCAWDDCQKAGFDEIKIIVREPRKTLHYIFCSEVHKRFYIASHRAYGKLTS